MHTVYTIPILRLSVHSVHQCATPILLMLWLAPSIRPCRTVDAEMVDRGPLAWAPVRLETENVEFDTGCIRYAALQRQQQAQHG